MLIPIISDIILILLLVLAIWTLLRISKSSQDQAAFTRFETRLEDYTKRIDLLEQRLGDLKFEQSEAASQLPVVCRRA